MIKKNITKWNRKIHIYLGLFLILFIWLFGFSGLLLNHHWEFSNSWDKKKVSNYDKTIELSKHKEKHILVQEMMDELSIDGSIYNMKYSNDSTQLSFIASHPGVRYEIKANLLTNKISIKKTKLDQWEIMKALHKLRNPTQKEENGQLQPMLAFIWGLAIDIVSVGLIIICLGGCYLWLQGTKKEFYYGLISILTGLLLSIYLVLL